MRASHDHATLPLVTRSDRRLGPLLLVAMLAAPALFCWFLLRRGYPCSLRVAGFSYAAVMTAVGYLATFAR